MGVVFFIALAVSLAVNGAINGFTTTGILQVSLSFILGVLFLLKRYRKLFFGKKAWMDLAILSVSIILSVLISYFIGLSQLESIQVRTTVDGRKASELIKKGEFQKAVDILEQQDEDTTITIDSRMNLGSAYLNLGETDRARRQYDLVIEKYPPNAICYFNYGLIYLNENNLEGAKNCFITSARYNPQLWMSYLYAGTMLRMQGDVRQALDMYIKADRRNPGQPQIKYMIARLTYDLNDIASAGIRIENALALDQTHQNRLELESMLAEVKRFEGGNRQ